MFATRGKNRAPACAGVALSLGLAACASVSPAITSTLAGGDTIEGRISVRYKDFGTGKEDALSGKFEWTRRDETIELALLDPLGQSVGLIRTSPASSSITFRDGRTVTGATPESLTQQALGWTVPVAGLASWLEGKPAPGLPATPLEEGAFRQDRWTVRFQPATRASDQPPRRIDLSFPGPPAEIEMRLVVDRRDPS